MTRTGLPASGEAGRRRWGVGGNPGPDIGSNKCRCLPVGSLPGDGGAVDSRRHGRGRLGGGRFSSTVAIDLTTVGGDGLPRAGHVAVAVRVAGGVVGHSH